MDTKGGLTGEQENTTIYSERMSSPPVTLVNIV